jgi:hypothetical protein
VKLKIGAAINIPLVIDSKVIFMRKQRTCLEKIQPPLKVLGSPINKPHIASSELGYDLCHFRPLLFSLL